MFDVGEDSKAASTTAPERPKAPRSGKPVEVRRLLIGLYRGRVWLIAALLVGIIAGVIIAKTLVPRVYESKAVIQWEPDQGEGAPSEPDVRELRTLVDSVKLPTNLAEIRKRLKIAQTLEQVGQRLRVAYTPESNIVTITADGPTGAGAKALADTSVQVFLDHQTKLADSRRDERVQSLEQDAQRARAKLGTVRASYDAFRKAHGVSDLSLERQHAIELAASLRAQADLARADAQAAGARAHVLASSTSGTRTPAESDALRQAKAQLAAARARLSEEHPRVQSLEAEVRALQAASPEGEGDRGGGATPAGHAEAAGEAARQRERTYEDLAHQAQQRLSNLSSVEGQASALLASVHVEEGHVADLSGALAKARDEARTGSNGFRVVAPALKPEEPERSYRRPAAVVIPMAVLLLTIAILLATELWGLRVFSANELSFWGQGAVVGTSTWPQDTRSLNALIDELGDLAPEAHGTTLVVAATEAQEEVAREVANRLQVHVAVRGGQEAVDAAYYDPETGSSVIVPAPAGREPRQMEKGAAIVTRRVDERLARTRAGHVQRVTVERSEVVMDGEDEEMRRPAVIEAWRGEDKGPALRRAARMADRVLVVVPSGKLSISRVGQIPALVGRQDGGLGYLLVGLPPYLATLPDRAGPVDAFWKTSRES